MLRSTKIVYLGSSTIEPDKQIADIKIREGKIYRRYFLIVDGKVVTTFASGSPAGPRRTILDSLCRYITVEADGEQVFRLSPYMAHKIASIKKGSLLQTGSSAGASAASLVTVTQAAGAAPFTYGTTGQITSVSEKYEIPRAHHLATDIAEQDSTVDDFRRCKEVAMRFEAKAFSNLLIDGNTAPVVYTLSTIAVHLYAEELTGVADNEQVQFFNNEFTESSVLFKTASEENEYKLKIRAATAAIYLGQFSGGTGLPPSDLVLDTVRLDVNNDYFPIDTDYVDLKNQMEMNHALQNPWVSNVCAFEGINILQAVKHSLSEAWNTTNYQGADVTSMTLTMKALAGVDVTKSAEVRVVQNRLTPPVAGLGK